jgi:hypothetical protein
MKPSDKCLAITYGPAHPDTFEERTPFLVISADTLHTILSRENSIIADEDVMLLMRTFVTYAKKAHSAPEDAWVNDGLDAWEAYCYNHDDEHTKYEDDQC